MSSKFSRRDLLKNSAVGIGSSLFLGSPVTAHAAQWADRTRGPWARRFVDVVTSRRSRRFAKGITTETGPLAYSSQKAPQPLTAQEEAFLVFCAVGITGFARGDLVYTAETEGTVMGGFIGRTVPSGDCIHSVSLFVINDTGTYYVPNPYYLSEEQVREAIHLAHQRRYVELYELMRVKIADARVALPTTPPFNFPFNQWAHYKPGTTYFLPVVDSSYLYINGVLAVLGTNFRGFPLDERRGLRPAGIAQYAMPNGHLSPAMATPMSVNEMAIERIGGIETGTIVQNILLGAQSMGIGAFPNYAGSELFWGPALGMQLATMRSSRYFGQETEGPNDIDINFPVALQKDGRYLMKPYCVPNYATMREAVEAVVERKFGEDGVYGAKIALSGFKNKREFSERVRALRPAPEVINASVDYCSYVQETYGRVPAYANAITTQLGVQVAHVDPDFYEEFYER